MHRKVESRKEEEELRQLIAELRVLDATGEALQSRLSWVNAAMTELALSKMSLEGVEKEKTDAPMFVPIGGGSYVKAKLENTDTVIVGIGAGVAVEKTLTEAKTILDERTKELEKTRANLQAQFGQVLNRVREDRARLEELDRNLRTRRAQSNVREAESGT